MFWCSVESSQDARLQKMTSLSRQRCPPGQGTFPKRTRWEESTLLPLMFQPAALGGARGAAARAPAPRRAAGPGRPARARAAWGTGRPSCACAARLAPRSAGRIRVPPILKARLSGPSRLGWRGNEVVSATPGPVVIGGDSTVRTASLGGPLPAESQAPAGPPGRGGAAPAGNGPTSGVSGLECKARRRALLLGRSREPLRPDLLS